MSQQYFEHGTNELSETSGLVAIILNNWAIAFFEYCFQVPANLIVFQGMTDKQSTDYFRKLQFIFD